MILCLDGAYGVGKTSIAEKIKEKLTDKAVEILESDYYYQKWMKEAPFLFAFGGGTMPQNNKNFVTKYRDLIKEKALQTDKIIISVMALTDEVSYKGIIGVLRDEGYNVKHIILKADKNTILERAERVNNDRKNLVLEWFDVQKAYYQAKMPNELYLDIEGRGIDDIAEEIISIIQE